MKLFLGTNFGHGAAVAAMNGSGELLYAAEEGRLSGVKDCDQFPERALRQLLGEFAPESLYWAEGWHRWQRFLYKGLASTFKYGLSDSSYFHSRLFKETHRLCSGLQAEFEWRRALRAPSFVGHHLAHAYSLLPWGLPARSLIVVSDTTAESAAISVFYWCGSGMRLLLEVPYPHSLGAAFHQMASHLGFKGRTAPGKLMALAGYGQPKWLDELKSIYNLTDRGFRFALHRYPAWRRKDAWIQFAGTSASSSLKREIEESVGCGEQGRDLARSVQDLFTAASLEIINDALRMARSRHGLKVEHLGLAGGAALNCQTNGHIVRAGPNLQVESITVSPWSDDPGTAIGAAAWLFHRKTRRLPQVVANSFLGPPACTGGQSIGVSESDIRTAAKVLQDGGVVALVSGHLEFGPRALGGRCLLGDARSLSVRDKLNAIKQRPSFMPIAPVVLEQDYSEYFFDKGSENMAWTVRSKAHALEEIPGAVHINGDVRAQVLRDEPQTLLWHVLTSFRSLTGTGVLLLTSLNGKDEPIAADLNIATAMARRMGLEGIICDDGWRSYSGLQTDANATG